jgi:hypothetical protein
MISAISGSDSFKDFSRSCGLWVSKPFPAIFKSIEVQTHVLVGLWQRVFGHSDPGVLGILKGDPEHAGKS